jgi:hypothetical protein
MTVQEDHMNLSGVLQTDEFKHKHVLRTSIHTVKSIYKKVNVCMYVCMFRHNYLSVNGIVSFPSFT